MTPEQRVIVRLWLTLAEIQTQGQERGEPLPTWRVDVQDIPIIREALDADGRGLRMRELVDYKEFG